MKAKFVKKMRAALPKAGALLLLSMGMQGTAGATTFIQCPGDDNNDGVSENPPPGMQLKCMHLGAGDGYSTMADGRRLYFFGFSDLTGIPEDQALDAGILSAASPAPTIVLDEGDEFFLTLTNYGMITRPDLADPHSVHFHGFPNASAIFDGIPEASISINMGASLTYYYNVREPGTYMYHCHVEATEHMQMGMLGNLYVRPAQNGTVFPGVPQTTYVYNDGDGSTAYDREYPIQIGSWDPIYHDASESTQPLPFANMNDTYPLLNGRGYPDTADTRAYAFPSTPGSGANNAKANAYPTSVRPLRTSQPVSSNIWARQGEKILLRISNLNVTNYYTLTTTGLPPMRVVGTGARILRGGGVAAGLDMAYDTASVTLGGGEAVDVIIDTTDVRKGTYFLYTTNMDYLSNNEEDFGGMMTEIRIL